jgi:adenylosuccinate synthase
LEDNYRKYMTYRERLSNYIGDVQRFLKEVVKGGKRVLIEGAQGIMLDVDHGTYPFVTSSNSGAGGACTGLGIPPSMIDCVIGVTKAYATRVGQGPFPTELKSGWGDILREKGGEYGATTGRPRRCGWFDVVGVKYATWLNGLDYLAITKVDVLDSFEKISFCVGYLYNGEILEEMPEETRILEACHPVYREMEGWQQNTLGLTSYGELPPQARIYLEEVSRLVGAEIALISTSPNREDVISLQNWW